LSYKQQERLVTGIFLFLICLQLAHFVHEGWFQYAHLASSAPPQPMQYADAYRLAIPVLVHTFSSIFHVHDLPFIFAVFDLVSGFLALYLLYRLTVDVPSGESNSPRDRVLKILCFLAILQFSTPWIIPQQRPETLPSTLFLALCLFCLTKIETNVIWSLPILGATFIQSFARTDVPFVFGIAVALVGIWTIIRHQPRTGRSYIVVGSLVTLIAGGIQTYFHRLYPQLSMDIQLKHNLSAHNLGVSLLSLLPFIVFFVFLVVKRPPLNILDQTAIACALIYLPMYFAFGVLSEVRIYSPFMLILSMVAARVLATSLSSRLKTAG
jgi:hypothetical protein